MLRRLREGDAALAQGVFDEFCRDMDHNLREMGISDQGVPRQMRRVGEAFYGVRRPMMRRSVRRGGGVGGGVARKRLRGKCQTDIAAAGLPPM